MCERVSVYMSLICIVINGGRRRVCMGVCMKAPFYLLCFIISDVPLSVAMPSNPSFPPKPCFLKHALTPDLSLSPRILDIRVKRRLGHLPRAQRLGEHADVVVDREGAPAVAGLRHGRLADGPREAVDARRAQPAAAPLAAARADRLDRPVRRVARGRDGAVAGRGVGGREGAPAGLGGKSAC